MMSFHLSIRCCRRLTLHVFQQLLGQNTWTFEVHFVFKQCTKAGVIHSLTRGLGPGFALGWSGRHFKVLISGLHLRDSEMDAAFCGNMDRPEPPSDCHMKLRWRNILKEPSLFRKQEEGWLPGRQNVGITSSASYHGSYMTPRIHTFYSTL